MAGGIPSSPALRDDDPAALKDEVRVLCMPPKAHTLLDGGMPIADAAKSPIFDHRASADSFEAVLALIERRPSARTAAVRRLPRSCNSHHAAPVSDIPLIKN